MASNIVNINNTDNNITVTNANQNVIVTDNNTGTSVNVTNPNTSIVQVNTLGPQGSIGAQGPSGSGSTINTSSFATTGSNTFIGDQFITGSLNADAQVYEVSFLQKDGPLYPFGDNLIELDQDLITNPNYTRNTNTITVNSSGLYKIYNQCRISVISGISDAAELAVFINNNPYRTYFINNIKQDEISTYNFSCVANLNASDTIEFHINSVSQPFVLNTFSKIYTSVINSYMTIEKLN